MAASAIRKKLRFAGNRDNASPAGPNWLKRQVTSVLQVISRGACLHPIHTIVVVALLASTTYVGLLEGSLFDAVSARGNDPGQVDVGLLLQGSRNLRLGERSSWKWQIDDASTSDEQEVGRSFFFFFCLSQ